MKKWAVKDYRLRRPVTGAKRWMPQSPIRFLIFFLFRPALVAKLQNLLKQLLT